MGAGAKRCADSAFAECYSCRESPNKAFRTKVTQRAENSPIPAQFHRELSRSAPKAQRERRRDHRLEEGRNSMKIKIEIQIDDDTAIYINRFLGTQEPETPLDTAGLTKMLLEDVALAVRRPGSWEGARMTDLLTSHGYSVE